MDCIVITLTRLSDITTASFVVRFKVWRLHTHFRNWRLDILENIDFISDLATFLLALDITNLLFKSIKSVNIKSTYFSLYIFHTSFEMALDIWHFINQFHTSLASYLLSLIFQTQLQLFNACDELIDILLQWICSLCFKNQMIQQIQSPRASHGTWVNKKQLVSHTCAIKIQWRNTLFCNAQVFVHGDKFPSWWLFYIMYVITHC